MAGIYIPNMQMPNKCEFIYICADSTAFKRVIGLKERQQIAHAIQVPDHGRCIDVDALEDDNITYYAVPVAYTAAETETMIQKIEMVIRLSVIDNAPTILPADTNKINKEE